MIHRICQFAFRRTNRQEVELLREELARPGEPRLVLGDGHAARLRDRAEQPVPGRSR
jgi:hypothetical protein